MAKRLENERKGRIQGAQARSWEQCPPGPQPVSDASRRKDRLTGAETGGHKLAAHVRGGQWGSDSAPARSSFPWCDPSPPPCPTCRGSHTELPRLPAAGCTSSLSLESGFSRVCCISAFPAVYRSSSFSKVREWGRPGRASLLAGGVSSRSWRGRRDARGRRGETGKMNGRKAVGSSCLPGLRLDLRGSRSEICFYLHSGSGRIVKREEMAEQLGAKGGHRRRY